MPEPVTDRLRRFQELERLLTDPQVLSDPRRLRETAREHAQLKPWAQRFLQLERTREQIRHAEELVAGRETQPEMRELAEAELAELRGEERRLTEELEGLAFEEDLEGQKSVIVEIRAGTGGAEASLFVMELYRMYTRYAARQSWTVESLSASSTEVGGFKEVIFGVEGAGAFRKLKFERGVHRVQRVPETEASGRIHTSTVTVAVLPQAEEVEVEIDPKDLRVDLFRSSGPGGQGVNTTDSAVRITHLPTGLVVSCQDERSQMKNRAKAMKVLRARLLERRAEEQAARRSQERRTQIGGGERAEKIRTYNFPDRRVTDHRINFTSHRLEEILEGNLDELIEPLGKSEREARLGGAEKR